jgi:hypothetical protein
MKKRSIRAQIEALATRRVAVHAAWLSGIPPLLRGAFTTETFNRYGFDDESIGLSHLHHFAGGQHVADVKETLALVNPFFSKTINQSLTHSLDVFDELERDWSEGIATLAARNGQPLLCWSSILRSIISARAVEELAGGRKLKILEVGPGSGYLSVLLGFVGHNVSSIDVSRGYGIWQSILYNYVGCYLLRRPVHNAMAPTALDPSAIYSTEHHDESRYDLVVANHMLNEMTRHSLCMLLESLEHRGANADVLVEGWGFGSRVDEKRNAQTENILNYFGYTLVYHHPMISKPKAQRAQARSNQSTKTQLPVSVFRKVRRKTLKNIKRRGDTLGNRSRRSLSRPVGMGTQLATTLRLPLATGSGLDQLYNERVLRDEKTNLPLTRLENKMLDYIGLNSHMGTPYLRGNSGYHF